MLIRDARPEDRDVIREVTLAAYQEYAALMPGFWDGYRRNIIVSLEEVGSLLYPPRRMKISRSDSLDMPWPEVRLLAVAPLARGRGVGAALMQECARRVRKTGGRTLSLHTTDMMHAALRMYERMGFVRARELDFHPAPGVTVKGYRLDLEEAG
jgi:GNAT superfamily N-acetyltransferase